MLDNVIVFGSLIKSLLALGINLTGKQYELLKWRTSEDAKKYYTEKENKEFYKELKRGNLKVVDAIRKEKQERINKLKNQLLKCLIPISFFFIVSCNSIPKYEKPWDVNSLRDEEKTYRIQEQNIWLSGKLNKTRFTDDWFLVHREFIKTHNENQDTLIETLELLKETKQKQERTQLILNYGSLGFISILFLMLIIQAFKRK
jgi:hypothetical protein